LSSGSEKCKKVSRIIWIADRVIHWSVSGLASVGSPHVYSKIWPRCIPRSRQCSDSALSTWFVRWIRTNRRNCWWSDRNIRDNIIFLLKYMQERVGNTNFSKIFFFISSIWHRLEYLFHFLANRIEANANWFPNSPQLVKRKYP